MSLTSAASSSISRRDCIRALLRERGLDGALLFSRREDSRYSRWVAGISCLSTYHYYFVSPERSGFLEIRYRAQDLRERLGDRNEEIIEFAEENVIGDALATLCRDWGRIGIVGEAPFNHLTGVRADLSDLTPELAAEMTVKSPGEAGEIETVARVLAGVLEDALAQVAPGTTERELGRRIRGTLLENSDGLAFPLSIVSGDRCRSTTLGVPTERTLKRGDPVCVDAGIYLDGMYADCTRMVRCGGDAFAEYDALRTVHRQIISELRTGFILNDVAVRYREQLTKCGLEGATLEAPDLGHGIGFALHEPPFFATIHSASTVLQEGMIFTLEPEIIGSLGRMRIEDMILIQGGAARILTAAAD